MQRGANGLGAVVEYRHLDRGRQHGFKPWQGIDHPVHCVDDVGSGLAEHYQVQALLVPGPGLYVGVFRPIDHSRHVLEVHRCAVLVGNDQLGVFVGVEQLVVGGQGRDAAVAVECALGQVQTGLLDSLAQVGQGQAQGREFFWCGLDPNGRALLAGDVDQADAVDLAQLPSQQGFGVIAQLVGGHLRRADA
ncbi:hypothetical protein D9M71_131230 [compost metagenome]